MISFILGVSLTVNVVLVIAIIIYLNVKKSSYNIDNSSKDFQQSLDESIISKDDAIDFLNNKSIDFSSLNRK